MHDYLSFTPQWGQTEACPGTASPHALQNCNSLPQAWQNGKGLEELASQ